MNALHELYEAVHLQGVLFPSFAYYAAVNLENQFHILCKFEFIITNSTYIFCLHIPQ